MWWELVSMRLLKLVSLSENLRAWKLHPGRPFCKWCAVCWTQMDVIYNGGSWCCYMRGEAVLADTQRMCSITDGRIITHTQSWYIRSDISLLEKSYYITSMSLLFLCKLLWESTKHVFHVSTFYRNRDSVWPESQTLVGAMKDKVSVWIQSLVLWFSWC